MAAQPGALRVALIDAGAGAPKAQVASEELVGFERDFADVRSGLTLLKAMNALSLAIEVAILLRLFIH